MSQNESERRPFFARSVPLKWVFVMAICLIVLMAAILVIVLLVDRSHDNARRAAAEAATSTTGVTSPYDLSELPADADLGVIMDAAFVSIYVPNESGTLTSYGVNLGLPAAQALSKAIMDAEKVEGAAGSVTGTSAATTGQSTPVSTITFVLPSRETLTFALDLDLGLISRGDQTWRPAGDLKALVKAAIAKPK